MKYCRDGSSCGTIVHAGTTIAILLRQRLPILQVVLRKFRLMIQYLRVQNFLKGTQGCLERCNENNIVKPYRFLSSFVDSSRLCARVAIKLGSFMSKEIRRAFDCCALLFLSSTALFVEAGLADSKLPRGKDSGPGVKYTIAEQVDPDGACYDYLTNPDQGYVSFNPFSKLAYLVGKSATLGEKDKDMRSYILEVGLETKRVYKKFNLSVVDNAALVAHQDPTKAVTILNFTEANFACCLLYTSPSPRDRTRSRMPSSA